ncbi:MurR/RpiR family transcriptional regulator [Actinoplanes bogorensis]|uniref:MurR/RpiR family transcriptional regulator n=1 Tax=Paractinoplanes bogorensis TaxID=1610840 RepID=A0ABS5Z7A5_9ACTN|nr:MurR/RpiR family transcriptional regulator [Actinoplanes bogorensis]MBU2670365.1 MurR/RpiR family transcriptional regulator [Actinoplanes bogorensis]
MTLDRQPDTVRAQDWLLDLAQRHRLSPTQRQIVQRMLGMFPDVAFQSTIEIAEQAGVSQPTVTRLATALGFAGYPEFRTALREVVLSHQGGPAVPHSAVDLEIDNLSAVRRELDAPRLAQAVELLAATTPLGVIGLRASAALAEYFGYFARRVLPAVQVHTDASVLDDAVLELRQQGAGAVLVFAMPRCPAATVGALRLARQLGLRTVVVADSPLVPFADAADVLLVAPVGTGLLFDSHAAVVVLAISLLDAIAGTDPERTQERLEAHEALVERWAF